jgi:predicted short-subunit dehydrogenase-like oxidoreductase (DUF2520 family)
MVNAKPLSSSVEITKIPDLFIICVSDDAIADVVNDYMNSGAVVVHTSGSTGMEVFDTPEKDCGVFYPLQTFTRNNAMDYSIIPFLIESATLKVEEMLSDLAKKISGSWFAVNSDNRRKIHVAAVFACNFSNHLVSIAHKLLKEEGLEINLLQPLLEQTMTKLRTLDPLSAQTGPAVREDQLVIDSHLKELEGMIHEQELYQLLTDNIIRYRSRNE